VYELKLFLICELVPCRKTSEGAVYGIVDWGLLCRGGSEGPYLGEVPDIKKKKEEVSSNTWNI
jgi:hypothetical protein